VVGNVLVGSSIAVQSNAEYRDHDTVTNPLRVDVVGNRVERSAAQAISLRYDAREGRQVVPGGGNRIVGNTVSDAGLAGIAVIAAMDGLATLPDEVSTNDIRDAFARGVDQWNTGYGITPAAGIVMGFGNGSRLIDNTVANSPGTTGVEVAVQLGLRTARQVTVDVVGAQTTRSENVPVTVGHA
jgi:hypothetical protein